MPGDAHKLRHDNYIKELLGRLRNDLDRLAYDFSAGLGRNVDNSSGIIRKTVGDWMEAERRGVAELSNSEKGLPSRGPAELSPEDYRRSLMYSGNAAPSPFDPAAPASIRNLPPLEELEFTEAPAGLGGNAFVVYRGEVLGIRKIVSYGGNTIEGVTNEINAPLIADRLGLENIVPDVVEWKSPLASGSLQEFVPNSGYISEKSMFTGEEGRKVAAFDYIVAAQDRNLGNALKRNDPSGGIAAIDNEQIMHLENIWGVDRVCSEFVYRNMNQELGSVSDSLRETDPSDFERFLCGLGYPGEDSTNSALRLVEIQEHGKIIGDAPGPPIVKPPTQSEIDALVRDLKGVE